MTHDDTGARAPDGVRRALGLAAEGMPSPDGLAETTWMRGRRVRRRRAVLSGAGATAVLGSTVLAWSLLGPAGLPGQPDVIPASAPDAASTGPTSAGPLQTTDGEAGTDGSGPVLVETAPEPTAGDPAQIPVDASAETERVWAVLRSACLEDRGYEVTVTGSTLSATKHGAQAGDYSRDTALCDAELGMRLPPVEVSFEDGEVGEVTDVALRAVYVRYVATSACVREAGLPVDEPPGAEEFVDLFAREWMPSWHPWTAAAAEGDYAQVRSDCPIGTS